jgi:pimeloyl-ACP methyl ester carboxylesterase
MFYNYHDGKIRYSVSGEGSPVVLLHGYLESSEIWNGFGEKMSENFRVIAIDLPGHGKSDVYGDTHSMEFMAEAVSTLLDFLKIDKTFVIGHSMGGYVTLAMADLFQNILSGYCLFHSQPFPDTLASFEKRKHEISMVKEGKKALVIPENIEKMFANSSLEKFINEVNRAKEIASETTDKGIVAVLNGMMQRPSRKAVMESGALPCLWILGALDNYIPLNVIRDKVNLPGNAKIIILESSGHMGFIEEQEESVKQITEFIDNL